jgi:hypothetical protein
VILTARSLSKQADYYTALSSVYLRLTKNLSISNICQINPSFLKEGRGKRQEKRGKRKSFEIVSFLATWRWE